MGTVEIFFGGGVGLWCEARLGCYFGVDWTGLRLVSLVRSGEMAVHVLNRLFTRFHPSAIRRDIDQPQQPGCQSNAGDYFDSPQALSPSKARNEGTRRNTPNQRMHTLVRLRSRHAFGDDARLDWIDADN